MPSQPGRLTKRLAFDLADQVSGLRSIAFHHQPAHTAEAEYCAGRSEPRQAAKPDISTPIETPTARRVRARGLHVPKTGSCRPGRLTRRSGRAMCGITFDVRFEARLAEPGHPSPRSSPHSCVVGRRRRSRGKESSHCGKVFIDTDIMPVLRRRDGLGGSFYWRLVASHRSFAEGAAETNRPDADVGEAGEVENSR